MLAAPPERVQNVGEFSSVGWVSRIDPPFVEQSIIISATWMRCAAERIGGSMRLTHPTRLDNGIV